MTNAPLAQENPNFYPFANLDSSDREEIYYPQNPNPESQELFQFIKEQQQNCKDAQRRYLAQLKRFDEKQTSSSVIDILPAKQYMQVAYSLEQAPVECNSCLPGTKNLTFGSMPVVEDTRSN